MLFNEDRKKAYIEDKSTSHSMESALKVFFNRLSEVEEYYNKDVVDFDDTELDDLLISFNCKTHQAITDKISLLRNYIYWEVEHGYCKSKNIIIDLPRFSNGCERYLNKLAIKYRYLKDKNELYKLINQLVNYKDKAIICLLYEGLYGKEFDEIRYLKVKDCDFENNIINVTGENARQIKCDSEIMNIILETINETEYSKINGNSVSKNPSIKLISSQYVIKVTERSRLQGAASPMTIAVLFSHMRLDSWNVNYNVQYISASTIRESGIFHHIAKIEEQQNMPVTDEQIQNILSIYGINSSMLFQYKRKYNYFKNNLIK